MSRSDDLRHILHDPDYWLGPPEPWWQTALASIGYGIAAVVATIIGLLAATALVVMVRLLS